MRTLAALAVAVVLMTTGCSRQLDCSAVGGIDGINITIPHALDVPSGSLAVEVCDDDGCASATHYVGRSTVIEFADLDRPFDTGTVRVHVELSDGTGSLVAVTEQTVELSRNYPNGKACDGEGYLYGRLRMSPADRVVTAE